MDDTTIVHRIGELVDEEHRLEQSHGDRPLSTEEHERMKEIEEHLDQCWDLLRQRRARRSAGQNPDEASERSISVVEHYQQ
ncbi:MAG: DUF2630 family protein [Acidimicrobiales bacterium]